MLTTYAPTVKDLTDDMWHEASEHSDNEFINQ
jgi:hypothetical protein